MPKDSRVPRVLPLVAVAVVVGCEYGDRASDSGGLEGAPVAIDPEPRLSLGVQAGDTLQEFFRILGPILMPDGSVAVPLGGESVIRVFDADGDFIEDLGGAGEGPAEFLTLGSAWLRGDTIEAGDSRLRRITRFFPDGSHEVISLREATGGTVVPGYLDHGWITGGVRGAAANGRDNVAFGLASFEGGNLGEVVRVEGMRRVPSMIGPHPLSPRAVVRMAGGRLYVGDTEAPRIRVFGSSGDEEDELSWEVSDRPDPDEAFRAVRESPDLSPAYEAAFEEASVPDGLSVFWDFLVGDLGFVWVRPYDPMVHAVARGGLAGNYLLSPMGGAGPWLVFSPTGEPAGSVEVPEGLRPVQVTGDAVVGIHVDHLGVERVRIHALTRN